MAEEIRQSVNAADDSKPGPFLARIVSHLDPNYMGVLEVELLHPTGNQNSKEGQIHQVRYMSPFAGITSVAYIDENNDYNSTQKSYGMWMVPPDVGSTVVVFFIDGKGYWFGCIMDPNTNFMIPGLAATSYVVDDSRQTDKEKNRVPVAEYNKKANDVSAKDTTQISKPEHPFAKTLEDQGLLKDDIRGITTSSARRETPSAVFGISTPGPIDKNGPKGKVGKFEHVIPEAFISRLGGSSFVMDDGDDKFLRKTKPTDGPSEYAAVENDETDGLTNIPNNELIRLRTRTGHQILLHNSEDLIYIGNSRGTAWIELTSDGKIDIFSKDSISIRTKQDFNFYCDRDFNLEVGRNFNTKVHGEMHTNIVKDQVLIVDRDQKIHIKNRKDETIEEEYRQTVNSHVKKFYATDYTHNIDGRVDIRIANGVSVTAGNGASGAEFAPMPATSQAPADSISSDEVTSSPVTDVNGPTPNRVDLNFFIDQRTTITGNLDINVSGHIFNTSGGTNETNAGGNIVETAPQIHMNGPSASTADTAEEARITAKSTIPLHLKTHKLPDLSTQDEWKNLETLDTLLRRVPTYEPYPHHENLDPMKFKPTKEDNSPGLDRDSDDRYHPASDDSPTETLSKPGKSWRTYTTSIDTFTKLPPQNKEEE